MEQTIYSSMFLLETRLTYGIVMMVSYHFDLHHSLHDNVTGDRLLNLVEHKSYVQLDSVIHEHKSYAPVTQVEFKYLSMGLVCDIPGNV